MLGFSYTRLAGLVVLVLVMTIPVSAANSIVVNSGNSQSATVNTDVATPPSIIVKDSRGAPISGVPVSFVVTTGGGSVSPATIVTGEDGIATTDHWTLGTTAGSNTLTASAENDTTSFTFEATGRAGVAMHILKIAGDGQSATAGTTVPIPPGVRIADTYNNSVNGATVVFSATPASSSVSGNSQTTSPDGIATVGSWTLGTVTGTNYLTATAGSLSVQFTAQAVESTDAPAISGISPARGVNTGTVSGVTIRGTHFSTTGGSVNLTKSGETNITGTCSRTTTSISCSFPLSGKAKGSWNVVVVNSDGKSGKLSGGFTIYSESDSSGSISSITPASGRVGESVDFSVTGKDFDTSQDYEVYLFKSGSENISADDVDVKSSTRIQGTFDLDDDEDLVDTYQVCIRDEFGNTECKKNAFDILTDKRGSIDISSNPGGAAIFLDGIANGTTPATLDDVLVGSHKIVLRKSGYDEWGKTITVSEENTAKVDARMSVTVASATRQTTSSTTVPKTLPRTTRTTAKSSLKIPTTYADVPTAATTSSPSDPLVVLGAAGLTAGLVVLRRR